MSIAVLIPCYKRPEYTKLCLDSVLDSQRYENVKFFIVDDGSNDGTWDLIESFPLKAKKVKNEENKGLRNVILDFFDWVQEDEEIQYITKIDNDCTVPRDWLNDLTRIIEESGADVISPNVSESNAAHTYGNANIRSGDFIPSKIVGGLWFMKKEMIEDIYFERFGSRGIRAAFNVIHQIAAEKDPKIGWTDRVTFGDVGFWGGSHPEHIKSLEHARYSSEVGRRIAWQPE